MTVKSKPSGVGTGDPLPCSTKYAAVHQVGFAIGAATSLPYLVDYEWTQDRPWVVDVLLSAHATFLRKAFNVGDLSVAGRDVKRTMQRRSHLRLRADEFAEAQKFLDGR